MRDLLWHYLLVVPVSYGFQGVVMMLVSPSTPYINHSRLFMELYAPVCVHPTRSFGLAADCTTLKGYLSVLRWGTYWADYWVISMRSDCGVKPLRLIWIKLVTSQ
nr:hypothetical protein [Salmonella enterica]